MKREHIAHNDICRIVGSYGDEALRKCASGKSALEKGWYVAGRKRRRMRNCIQEVALQHQELLPRRQGAREGVGWRQRVGEVEDQVAREQHRRDPAEPEEELETLAAPE